MGKRPPMTPEQKMRRKARVKAREAIKLGKLTRQACEGCGTPEKTEAHHDDYSKPLDVRWLCKTCHAAVHAHDPRPRKTHCHRGHILAGKNLRICIFEGRDMRGCRQCATDRNRIRKRQIREQRREQRV